MENWETDFILDLKSAIRTEKWQYVRKALKTYIFKLRSSSSGDFLDHYFACLRLVTRSAKREMRNRDALDSPKTVDEEFAASFDFGGVEVSMVIKLSTNKTQCVRTDLVHSLGSYEDINQALEALNERGFTDGDICLAWRAMSQGLTPNMLLEFFQPRLDRPHLRALQSHLRLLYRTFHLLFGVETIRNPSAFSHIVMLMYLVQKGEMKLDLTVLPMSGKSAVPVSRHLNRYARRYTYDRHRGDSVADEKVANWITLEKSLLKNGGDYGGMEKAFADFRKPVRLPTFEAVERHS